MHSSSDRPTRTRRAFRAVPVAIALLLATACSQVPEPEENIDSLTSVTEAPEESSELDQFDATLHPDPIADPMECSRLLVVMARGTGEPAKGQLLSPVSRAIEKEDPDAIKTLNLDYPADTNVNEGGTEGVRRLIDTLNVQADHCPAQRFALLGYSQGALVIGDALSEPAMRLVGENAGELTDQAGSAVLAVVLYGNPRFSPSEPFDEGDFDASLSGILPRQPDGLAPYADRVRDFCVARDFICQSSLDLDEEGHVTYYKNGMQQEGAEFVLEKYRLHRAAIRPTR